jgi:hypothetical protein
MRIEHRCLAADRLDNVRMAMPDMRNIVVHIEVPCPASVIKPDTFAAH